MRDLPFLLRLHALPPLAQALRLSPEASSPARIYGHQNNF